MSWIDPFAGQHHHEPRCGNCGHVYSLHGPSGCWERNSYQVLCSCIGWAPHPSGMDPHPRGRAVDPIEATYIGESDLE